MVDQSIAWHAPIRHGQIIPDWLANAEISVFSRPGGAAELSEHVRLEEGLRAGQLPLRLAQQHLDLIEHDALTLEDANNGTIWYRDGDVIKRRDDPDTETVVKMLNGELEGQRSSNRAREHKSRRVGTYHAHRRRSRTHSKGQADDDDDEYVWDTIAKVNGSPRQGEYEREWRTYTDEDEARVYEEIPEGEPFPGGLDWDKGTVERVDDDLGLGLFDVADFEEDTNSVLPDTVSWVVVQGDFSPQGNGPEEAVWGFTSLDDAQNFIREYIEEYEQATRDHEEEFNPDYEPDYEDEFDPDYDSEFDSDDDDVDDEPGARQLVLFRDANAPPGMPAARAYAYIVPVPRYGDLDYATAYRVPATSYKAIGELWVNGASLQEIKRAIETYRRLGWPSELPPVKRLASTVHNTGGLIAC